ncbi:hypothetical protein [Roseixanthobacter glucoisosaccharinicivorans]|uniref:hypothetical protein n=1 Tax=Roseixanthobacter glucoisosaccharinicivorans TaxID=3119923 RepID=UPI003729F083
MLKRAILAPSVVLALGIGVAGFAAGGFAFADGTTLPAKSTDRISASEGTSGFAMTARATQLADATPPGPRDRQPVMRDADQDGTRRTAPGLHPSELPGNGPFAGRPPLGGQVVAAASLAAMETFVGIRADQFDAWRTYTNAVLALLQPPKPPQEAEKPAPFARAEAIARHMAEQGAKAQAVLDALAALKSKLTEDQLQRAAELSALLPPGPPRGPLAFAFGAPLAPPMPPPGVEHPHLGGHGPQALPDPSDADTASQHPRPAL